jgi:hypothetical protein
MKQVITICCLVALLVTITVISMANKQRHNKRQIEPSDTGYGLQLSTELDGETFHLQDVAKLIIKLKNVSQGSITLYKHLAWGRSSSFTMFISDEHGKAVRGTFLEDAMHVPPFSKDDFVTIQPGESVEIKRLVDMRGDGIKASGIYQIAVRYHSPVPREFAPEGLEIWAMENGVLQSKPVTFKVTR